MKKSLAPVTLELMLVFVINTLGYAAYGVGGVSQKVIVILLPLS